MCKKTIDLKKKIFRRWIDEPVHIGDIPPKEIPISLWRNIPDVLRTVYHLCRLP